MALLIAVGLDVEATVEPGPGVFPRDGVGQLYDLPGGEVSLQLCPHGVVNRNRGVGERLGVGEDQLLHICQKVAVFPIGDGVDRGVVEPQLTAEGEC